MSNSHQAQERGGCYRKREGECDTFKAKERSMQGVGQEGLELCPRAWTTRAMGNYVRVLSKHIIFIHSFNRKSLPPATGQVGRLWLYHRGLHEAEGWGTGWV